MIEQMIVHSRYGHRTSPEPRRQNSVAVIVLPRILSTSTNSVTTTNPGSGSDAAGCRPDVRPGSPGGP